MNAKLHQWGKLWIAHMPSLFYLIMTARFWWGLTIFAWFPPFPVCSLCSQLQGHVLPPMRTPLCRLQDSLQFFLYGIIQKRFPIVKMHFFFPLLLSRSYLPTEAAHMDLLFFLQDIWTLFHIQFMASVRSVWDFYPTHCSTLHAQCFMPLQFYCFLSFLSCIQSQTGLPGWDCVSTCPSVTQNGWCRSSCLQPKLLDGIKELIITVINKKNHNCVKAKM